MKEKNIKIAILLLCHKNPEQINILLEKLENDNIDCFLHIDAKNNDMEEKIISRRNVYIIPDKIDVKWGEYSQVLAHLKLIEYGYKNGDYDYYWQCSGQDYPIRDTEEILRFFQKNRGKNFIRFWDSLNYRYGKENNLDKRNIIYYPRFLLGRSWIKRVAKRLYVQITGGYMRTFSLFRRKNRLTDVKKYYGPNWMCLSKDVVAWMLGYIRENTWYETAYKNSPNPDESFFHTLFMKSDFSETRMDYLHKIRFSNGANSPDVFTIDDFDELISCRYLMARKFDINIDAEILKYLPVDARSEYDSGK